MPKKISPELRDRAVRLVVEHQQDYPSRTAACVAVAKQLGLARARLRAGNTGSARGAGLKRARVDIALGESHCSGVG